MMIKMSKVKPKEPKGGKNSNNVLLSYLAKEIKRKQGTNLQEAAEKESSGPNHMNIKLSRAMFGKIISHLNKKTIDP